MRATRPNAALPTAGLLVVAVLLAAAPAASAQIPGLTPAAPGAGQSQAPAATVEARTTPEQDADIARRLREIYDTVDGLGEVRVTVHAGVVSLSGDVLTESARDQALGLARQIRGVVEVEDSIHRVRDVRRRLGTATARLRDSALDLVAELPLLAVALVLFVLFWWLGRWVGSLDRPFRRLAPNRFLRDLLAQALRTAVVLLGAILALEVLDATALVAAVAGAAGLAGLAIGFAFRDLVENYIASVLLSLRQPFLPGDLVVIEGHEGKVVRLNSRATILITLDGNHVRIPNAQVFKGVILNYTRNPRRRFDFTVGVGVDADLAAALALALDTVGDLDGVLAEPPPQGWIDELGDSNVLLHLFAWIDQRDTEWAKARGEAIRRVKVAFDDAGIAMPEPIFNVRLEQRREAEAAAAKEARAAKAGAFPGAAGDEETADLSADTHLDREVAEERAAEGDLLNAEAPVE